MFGTASSCQNCRIQGSRVLTRKARQASLLTGPQKVHGCALSAHSRFGSKSPVPFPPRSGSGVTMNSNSGATGAEQVISKPFGWISEMQSSRRITRHQRNSAKLFLGSELENRANPTFQGEWAGGGPFQSNSRDIVGPCGLRAYPPENCGHGSF